MLVVSDTSPLNGLFRIGHLHLLEILFGRIIVPTEVAEELASITAFGFDPETLLAHPWIEVRTSQTDPVFQKTLDKGEAAAISLAKELKADILLVDELKARNIAKKEGFKVIGILGVLLLAKSKGHITSVAMLMDLLIHDVGFWIDGNLYQEVKSLAGE
jgi:hypothetical protein